MKSIYIDLPHLGTGVDVATAKERENDDDVDIIVGNVVVYTVEIDAGEDRRVFNRRRKEIQDAIVATVNRMALIERQEA